MCPAASLQLSRCFRPEPSRIGGRNACPPIETTGTFTSMRVAGNVEKVTPISNGFLKVALARGRPLPLGLCAQQWRGTGTAKCPASEMPRLRTRTPTTPPPNNRAFDWGTLTERKCVSHGQAPGRNEPGFRREESRAIGRMTQPQPEKERDTPKDAPTITLLPTTYAQALALPPSAICLPPSASSTGSNPSRPRSTSVRMS